MPVKDLSQFHHKLTGLFPWPESSEQWKEYELPAQKVDFFRKNGFVSGIKLLDDHQINFLREELAAVADPSHEGHELFYEFHSNESTDPSAILFHALGAWRIMPGFHDVLWNPRFLAAADQLMEHRAIRFWHDQLFWKPPKQGGVVAWHQDYSYWTRTKPVAHLTCWCALDDATIGNGCLQYIPGSHEWGLLPKPVIAGDLEGIKDSLNDEQRAQFGRPQFAEVKAGEAIFHHSLTLHGSGANRSSNPRRAFVINIIADGVISDSNEPLLDGVPVIQKGNKISGQFFPLLTTEFPGVDFTE
jgi:ectoine hydroxylase-related dioxygenase (phytanoyl-CoA dioxygenase family)